MRRAYVGARQPGDAGNLLRVSTDEDVAHLDELATRRARHRIEHIFSEYKIPGCLDGDLFRFGVTQRTCARSRSVAPLILYLLW